MSNKLEPILAARGVEFRQSGDDEILVHCPLCGASDPSQHLSINTRGRGWRCLRNPAQHRGRSYQRLLALLFRIGIEEAAELLGQRATFLPDQETFSEQWRKQLGVSEENPRPKSLTLPKEFHPLIPHAKRSGAFWDYLIERGYRIGEAEWAAKTYNLHFAITGRYAYRIVIPVYDGQNRLLTWTARSISPNADIRYMTLKKTEAVAPPGEVLLGLDQLWRAAPAKCLVVCEGPFDAIAISALGHKHGVLGTCFFGLEASLAQVDLIAELGNRFERTRFIIDPGAWTRNLALRSRLPKRCRPETLPEGLKDPGDLVKWNGGYEFVRSLAA